MPGWLGWSDESRLNWWWIEVRVWYHGTEIIRKTEGDKWQDFSINMEKCSDGKWKQREWEDTAQATATICVCAWWCWGSEEHSGRWAVSCRPQAPLPPQLQYRQTGSYQAVTHVLGLLYGHCIPALLHVLIMKKGLCYQSMFWNCSAVAGVTFLSLGGDSLDSATLLVWGLWLWCLLPYFPPLHHEICFASLLTEWLAPQFTGL